MLSLSPIENKWQTFEYRNKESTRHANKFYISQFASIEKYCKRKSIHENLHFALNIHIRMLDRL